MYFEEATAVEKEVVACLKLILRFLLGESDETPGHLIVVGRSPCRNSNRVLQIASHTRRRLD
jgi:hypothetical protein